MSANNNVDLTGNNPLVSGLIPVAAPAHLQAVPIGYEWNDASQKFQLNEPFGGRGGGGGGGDDGPPPEPIDPNMNLNYVGGLDEVVTYLRRNVIIPYINATRGGAASEIIEPAKGIIFYGPPGTGKSLMGKCLAGELKRTGNQTVNFFMRKGTDVFSKWVGESERNLREVFAKAIRGKPSILFFDEIDGLVPARQDGMHQHNVSVITSFLGLVDSVKRGEVFIIGATNRLDALDPAVLRPGRFDKHIRFTPPNAAGRRHILNVNLDKWNSSKPSEKDINVIVEDTVGYTGADLEQLIRNAINCAMDRQFPDLGKKFEGLEEAAEKLRDLKVTLTDWKNAMSGMASTNPNVFGSTIYCGVPMDAVIRPLIGGIVENIKSKMNKFFLECGQSNKAGKGINSLLVYGANESATQTIDSLIIPSVIGSFDSERVKGFIASETQSGSVYGALAKAISSAREKPSILFIPRIDKLWQRLSQYDIQHTFLREVAEVRGTNVVVLASAAADRDVLPYLLQTMFEGLERSVRLRNPTKEETREFLQPVFNLGSGFHKNLEQCSKANLGCTEQKKLDSLLTKAVASTTGQGIRSILTFHQELLLGVSTLYNRPKPKEEGKKLAGQLEQMITAYEKTKYL